MISNKILKDILSDPELMKKYGLTEKQIEKLTTTPAPESKTIVTVLSEIINGNDNNRSSNQIYRTIKNIHNI